MQRAGSIAYRSTDSHSHRQQSMNPPRFFVLAGLYLAASLSHAAGITFIDIPADKDGPPLRGAVWSPCSMPAEKIVLGPLVIDAVKNCPLSGERLPLVVISHGTGGSFLGHHDTAAALADAGFVVAAISHPGDNFQDRSRQTHLSVFATRPNDMKRLLDYMLASWQGHDKLDTARIGIFGFSRGGYTALAAIGSVPNWTIRKDLCPPGSTIPACEEISRKEFPAPPVPDPRIKAAVIADPLNFFDAQGLKQVTIPIQLWASAYGGDGVTPQTVAALRHALPVAQEWHVAANAAHFAFLAPCTPALASASPVECRDDPGFNRVSFHAMFDVRVVRFFERSLGR